MKNIALILSVTALLLVAAACGSSDKAAGGLDAGSAVIKTAPMGKLSVTLSSDSGHFKKGENDFLLTVKDASGNPVEVSAVSLSLRMPAMGTMPEMSDTASFETTKATGVCRGKIDIEMAGEWQARVVYDGPAGRAETSFPVVVQ